MSVSSEPLSTAAPASAQPTLRRRRRWRGFVLLAVLAVAASWLWLVPRVIEATLVSRLETAGFGEVRCDGVQVGFGSLVVRNLLLGAGDAGGGSLQIGTVTAAFGVRDLLAGRVDDVEIVEPTWTRSPLPGRGASPFDAVLRRDTPDAAAATARPLPPLRCRRLAIRGGRIATPAREPVTFAGTLTADAGQWRCEADAAIGTFRMQAAANLREEGGHAVGIVELGVPGTQPFELSGTCSITVDQRSRVLELDLERRPGPFDVAFDGNRWSGDGALAVQALVPFADLDAATFGLRAAGLDVASANGAQLRGMAAELAFHGLPLPVSDGWQTVRWQQVALADLRAGEGSADFVLARGPELHARFRQRAMDDIGELAVSDVRWAPGAESIPATVTLDRVPLQDCLELLSKGRITGEGRLSGTATLAVHTEPRLRVDLHGGRVSAAPGGLVRFLDDAETEALLRSQVGGGGAAGGSEQVQERLVAALKEFVYEVLDFSFQPEGEETVLRVHVAGEGRTVPQKIGIDINVRGFEEALDAAIAIKLGLDRAKQRLAEKIEDPHETVPVQRKP